MLISHIVQLLLIRKFYCFCKGWYISFKYARQSFTLPNAGRSIPRNIAQLNILVHDVINLLYYEYRTDKQNYFYVLTSYKETCLAINHAKSVLKKRDVS